jgi:hypothetical protein
MIIGLNALNMRAPVTFYPGLPRKAFKRKALLHSLLPRYCFHLLIFLFRYRNKNRIIARAISGFQGMEWYVIPILRAVQCFFLFPHR